jgi:hypothetical protein
VAAKLVELATRIQQSIPEARQLSAVGGQSSPRLLEIACRPGDLPVAIREPRPELARLLLAVGEILARIGQRSLEIGKLASQLGDDLLASRDFAITLVYLALALLELALRVRDGLLALGELALAIAERRIALGELALQILEVALVGGQQLTLSLDLVLALVQRVLQSHARGRGVLPILFDAAVQDLDVASQSSHLLVVARRVIALLLVALANLVVQLLDLGRQLDEAMLALGERGSHALVRRGAFADEPLALGELLLQAAEIGLDCSATVVGVGERSLETGDLATQRLDVGLDLEGRRRVGA